MGSISIITEALVNKVTLDLSCLQPLLTKYMASCSKVLELASVVLADGEINHHLCQDLSIESFQVLDDTHVYWVDTGC